MASVQRELKEYGLFPRKKLGQHFLVDKNILNKVIHTAEVKKEDVVLEVGPGLGEMTLALSHQAKKVIAIEIDSKLATILEKKIKNYPNIEVVRGDILKMDFASFMRKEGQPIKVVANLPYQISTPLLFRFIESKEVFSSFTLMLQKEVAERVVAPPGEKEYGPLSILIQIYLDVSIRFILPPSAFFPSPKVESAVVHMIWKKRPLIKMGEEEWFKAVVKACFGYRRKTLVNALRYSKLFSAKSIRSEIESIGIDPQRRPETLTLEEFMRLSEALK